MTKPASPIARRIERDYALPDLVETLSAKLPASDLHSLLMEVFSRRAEALAPTQLLKQYAGNPYARPADWNAAKYRALECAMLDAAEERGARSVLLSPAAILGSCAAFGAVSQNKILSANRGLEILSDATNMLALLAAEGIKQKTLLPEDAPHRLCATHRHMRYSAQLTATRLAHFGLFTMVSAGPSQSSYAFEEKELLFHLAYYIEHWRKTHGVDLSLIISPRGGYKDGKGFIQRMRDAIARQFPDTSLRIDETENTTAYYLGLRITMHAPLFGQMREIGDMGFTNWTQKLLNQKGERLLISSNSLDAQMALLSADG